MPDASSSSESSSTSTQILTVGSPRANRERILPIPPRNSSAFRSPPPSLAMSCRKRKASSRLDFPTPLPPMMKTRDASRASARTKFFQFPNSILVRRITGGIVAQAEKNPAMKMFSFSGGISPSLRCFAARPCWTRTPRIRLIDAERRGFPRKGKLQIAPPTLFRPKSAIIPLPL